MIVKGGATRRLTIDFQQVPLSSRKLSNLIGILWNVQSYRAERVGSGIEEM